MLTGASILYLRDVVIYITPHVYDSYYERFIIFFNFVLCAEPELLSMVSAVLTN